MMDSYWQRGYDYFDATQLQDWQQDEDAEKNREIWKNWIGSAKEEILADARRYASEEGLTSVEQVEDFARGYLVAVRDFVAYNLEE